MALYGTNLPDTPADSVPVSCHQEPTQDLPEIGDEGHGAPQILKILWESWKFLQDGAPKIVKLPEKSGLTIWFN